MNANTTHNVPNERDELFTAFESYDAAVEADKKFEEQRATNARLMAAFNKGPSAYVRKVTEAKKTIAGLLKTAPGGFEVTVGEPWFSAGSYDGGWQPGRWSIGSSVEFSRVRDHITSWRSVATDQLQIIVGDHGNKKRFPQKKDGSFSYDKIVAAIIEREQERKARVKRQAEENSAYRTKAANHLLRDAVTKDLGLSPYDSNFAIEGSSKVAGKLDVKVTFARYDLTTEQVKELYVTLTKAGLLKATKQV